MARSWMRRSLALFVVRETDEIDEMDSDRSWAVRPYCRPPRRVDACDMTVDEGGLRCSSTTSYA